MVVDTKQRGSDTRPRTGTTTEVVNGVTHIHDQKPGNIGGGSFKTDKITLTYFMGSRAIHVEAPFGNKVPTPQQKMDLSESDTINNLLKFAIKYKKDVVAEERYVIDVLNEASGGKQRIEDTRIIYNPPNFQERREE